jgi:hypothetical protein
VIFLSFSCFLGRTHQAARFFDSAARASSVISFLPLSGMVGEVAMNWVETTMT